MSRSRRFRVTMATVVAALAAIIAPLPASTPTPASGSTYYNQYRGPNTTSKVVLSFDDCPVYFSQFRSVVLAAEQMHIRLVMFPTGQCIKTGRFSVWYALAHGHVVGNHTITHPQLTTLSYYGVLRELGLPGVQSKWARPPYGSINSTVRSAMAAKGMKPWLWTVDTNDWRGKSSSTLIRYVVSYSRPGDTVLMHMGWNGFNAPAIRAMKAGLANRGLQLCYNDGVMGSTFRC